MDHVAYIAQARLRAERLADVITRCPAPMLGVILKALNCFIITIIQLLMSGRSIQPMPINDVRTQPVKHNKEKVRKQLPEICVSPDSNAVGTSPNEYCSTLLPLWIVLFHHQTLTALSGAKTGPPLSPNSLLAGFKASLARNFRNLRLLLKQTRMIKLTGFCSLSVDKANNLGTSISGGSILGHEIGVAGGKIQEKGGRKL